jgi:hypothetical protein
LKYRFAGKKKRLAPGVYPDVTMKEARARREEARRLLANGVDPGIERKVKKNSNGGARRKQLRSRCP